MDLITELKSHEKWQYRAVDTSTLKGLKQAERLHQASWKIISHGLFIIQFQKKVA